MNTDILWVDGTYLQLTKVYDVFSWSIFAHISLIFVAIYLLWFLHFVSEAFLKILDPFNTIKMRIEKKLYQLCAVAVGAQKRTKNEVVG